MSDVSNFYSSSERLRPVNRNAAGCLSATVAVGKGTKTTGAMRTVAQRRKTNVMAVPEGVVDYKKASSCPFIPTGVVVDGFATRLSVPGWTAAFSAIMGRLRQSLGDNLNWIESKYTACDERDGYCLFCRKSPILV